MSANTEAQGSGRGLEAMKWIIVAVLLIVAIVGNFLYRDIMLAVRALAVGVYTPNHSSLRATANQLLLCNSRAGVTPPSTLKQFE